MRSVVALVALVAGVHLGVWALLSGRVHPPDFDGQFASLSYDIATAHDEKGPGANYADIRNDMRLLSPYTRAVRTYSSTRGLEQVPAAASEFGVRVAVGAWLNKQCERPKQDKYQRRVADLAGWLNLGGAPTPQPGSDSAECDPSRVIEAAQDANQREIQSALNLARKYSNVSSIVVGNETIYRDDMAVPELIKLIKQVKRQSDVPVTTGEIWNVWLDHPELVAAVDYIAVHILPYWEGTTAEQTVQRSLEIYEHLRQAYPGKRIVIAEFGWPSAGYNRQASVPGRFEQASVLRHFVSRADQFGIDYNLIEAFDQPWKTMEGSVGTYWGVFNHDREQKFPWTGPVVDPIHWKLAGIAVLLGILLSLPLIAASRVTAMQALLLTAAAHGVGAWFATLFAYWHGHYFVWGAVFALGFGTLLLIPLVLIALARIEEIAAVAFGRKPLRLVAAPPMVPEATTPKVSIHIPAYREPPEMLKQTLDSVAALDYPNFECVVVINNTPDPAHWQPIEEHCRQLGDRFKFLNVLNLKGFKAGALRLALEHTAPDAEIIGVIDADYVVEPDWLSDLVHAFDDPKVGLVQAPQDHRDEDRSVMHYAMNGEYAGFFDIGMVQRNESNAIIVHGTMCLVRRAALDAAGGWSSDTICEDTDLGLTIIENGYRATYTDRRYGHGLLPDTFESFKKQRDRWAYGGVQIVRKHWRRFLPGGSALSREQRREFLLGWLNWLGAESVGVLMAILNLIWVPIVAFVGISVPDKVLTLPILFAFVVSVLHFLVLYRLRVRIPASQTLTAMFTAMSVQWTVARAVATGLFIEHLPFRRTDKGGATRKGAQFPAFWETVLGLSLLTGAVTVYMTNHERVQEINLYAVILVVQSLPFLAASLLALLEGSRFNDLALWRRTESRLSELFARRGALEAPQPQNSVEPI